MKKFTLPEILIVLVSVLLIFVSEYQFIIEKDTTKAIFIGLWPPTIIGLLNYFNSKKIK